MSGNGIYATGWYSVSPAFAWWNFDVHRMAALKARRKQRELLKKINNKRKTTLQKLQKEQYRYMRSKKSTKKVDK